MYLCVALIFSVAGCAAGGPSLVLENSMRVLLLPFDTPVGSLVYRLKGFDSESDYPLKFSVSDVGGASLVAATLIEIIALPCRKGSSNTCEADVYLRRRLEKGRVYDFYLNLEDQDRQSFRSPSRITATSGTYLVKDRMITVPEDKAVGSIIMEVLAQRADKSVPVHFDVRGSSDFSMTTHLAKNNADNGTIQIAKPLDFERQTVYQLEVLALYGYTNRKYDTRNVDALKLVVAITDVQDTPPVFVSTPPLTRVSDNIPIGAKVLTVEAEDGDKGEPREIRYNLIKQGEKWGAFFNMEPNTGNVILADSLSKLPDLGIDTREPLIMRIGAEELTTQAEYNPSMSTVVEIGLIVDPAEDYPPEFSEKKYYGNIDENSPSGTSVTFTSQPMVKDKGKGDKGIFKLSLESFGNMFEVTPVVVTKRSEFKIIVKNPQLLDYETLKQVEVKILAREVTDEGAKSSMCEAFININDINDNSPVFVDAPYLAELPENVGFGAHVITVKATDKDSLSFGEVRYTGIKGAIQDFFTMDPVTGVISMATSNHVFDREKTPQYLLSVEARDEKGGGTLSTAKLTIRLLDVNDSPPKFLEPLYEGYMDPITMDLKTPIHIKAVDDDEEGPNSDVRYEITSGNRDNLFEINPKTGKLDVAEDKKNGPKIASLRDSGSIDDIINLQVRAYDLGVPHQNSSVPVEIYTSEFVLREVRFLWPKSERGVKAKKKQIEQTLSAITGSNATIVRIEELENTPNGKPRTEVRALIRSRVDGVIDMNEIFSQLNSLFGINITDGSTRVNGSGARNEKYTEEEFQLVEDQMTWFFWGMIIALIILILAVLIILLCCCCECCCFEKNEKGEILEDDSRMLMIRNREPPVELNRSAALKDRIIEVFSAKRRSREGSLKKQAWSGNENDRKWKFIAVENKNDLNNQRYGNVRSPVQAVLYDSSRGTPIPGSMHQSELVIEEVDDISKGKQVVLLKDNYRKSGNESTRLWIIRDEKGNIRDSHSLTEGERYTVEEGNIEEIRERASRVFFKGPPPPQFVVIQRGNKDNKKDRNTLQILSVEDGSNFTSNKNGNVQILRLASPGVPTESNDPKLPYEKERMRMLQSFGKAQLEIDEVRDRNGPQSEVLLDPKQLGDIEMGNFKHRGRFLEEPPHSHRSTVSEAAFTNDKDKSGKLGRQRKKSKSFGSGDFIHDSSEEDSGRQSRTRGKSMRASLHTPIIEEPSKEENNEKRARSRRRDTKHLTAGESLGEDNDFNIRGAEPGSHIYSQTKTSVLRKQTNDAKIAEHGHDSDCDHNHRKISTLEGGLSRRNSIAGLEAGRESANPPLSRRRSISEGPALNFTSPSPRINNHEQNKIQNQAYKSMSERMQETSSIKRKDTYSKNEVGYSPERNDDRASPDSVESSDSEYAHQVPPLYSERYDGSPFSHESEKNIPNAHNSHFTQGSTKHRHFSHRDPSSRQHSHREMHVHQYYDPNCIDCQKATPRHGFQPAIVLPYPAAYVPYVQPYIGPQAFPMTSRIDPTPRVHPGFTPRILNDGHMQPSPYPYEGVPMMITNGQGVTPRVGSYNSDAMYYQPNNISPQQMQAATGLQYQQNQENMIAQQQKMMQQPLQVAIPNQGQGQHQMQIQNNGQAYPANIQYQQQQMLSPLPTNMQQPQFIQSSSHMIPQSNPPPQQTQQTGAQQSLQGGNVPTEAPDNRPEASFDKTPTAPSYQQSVGDQNDKNIKEKRGGVKEDKNSTLQREGSVKLHNVSLASGYQESSALAPVEEPKITEGRRTSNADDSGSSESKDNTAKNNGDSSEKQRSRSKKENHKTSRKERNNYSSEESKDRKRYQSKDREEKESTEEGTQKRSQKKKELRRRKKATSSHQDSADSDASGPPTRNQRSKKNQSKESKDRRRNDKQSAQPDTEEKLNDKTVSHKFKSDNSQIEGSSGREGEEEEGEADGKKDKERKENMRIADKRQDEHLKTRSMDDKTEDGLRRNQREKRDSDADMRRGMTQQSDSERKTNKQNDDEFKRKKQRNNREAMQSDGDDDDREKKKDSHDAKKERKNENRRKGKSNEEKDQNSDVEFRETEKENRKNEYQSDKLSVRTDKETREKGQEIYNGLRKKTKEGNQETPQQSDDEIRARKDKKNRKTTEENEDELKRNRKDGTQDNTDELKRIHKNEENAAKQSDHERRRNQDTTQESDVEENKKTDNQNGAKKTDNELERRKRDDGNATKESDEIGRKRRHSGNASKESDEEHRKKGDNRDIIIDSNKENRIKKRDDEDAAKTSNDESKRNKGDNENASKESDDETKRKKRDDEDATKESDELRRKRKQSGDTSKESDDEHRKKREGQDTTKESDDESIRKKKDNRDATRESHEFERKKMHKEDASNESEEEHKRKDYNVDATKENGNDFKRQKKRNQNVAEQSDDNITRNKNNDQDIRQESDHEIRGGKRDNQIDGKEQDEQNRKSDNGEALEETDDVPRIRKQKEGIESDKEIKNGRKKTGSQKTKKQTESKSIETQETHNDEERDRDTENATKRKEEKEKNVPVKKKSKGKDKANKLQDGIESQQKNMNFDTINLNGKWNKEKEGLTGNNKTEKADQNAKMRKLDDKGEESSTSKPEKEKAQNSKYKQDTLEKEDSPQDENSNDSGEEFEIETKPKNVKENLLDHLNNKSKSRRRKKGNNQTQTAKDQSDIKQTKNASKDKTKKNEKKIERKETLKVDKTVPLKYSPVKKRDFTPARTFPKDHSECVDRNCLDVTHNHKHDYLRRKRYDTTSQKRSHSLEDARNRDNKPRRARSSSPRIEKEEPNFNAGQQSKVEKNNRKIEQKKNRKNIPDEDGKAEVQPKHTTRATEGITSGTLIINDTKQNRSEPIGVYRAQIEHQNTHQSVVMNENEIIKGDGRPKSRKNSRKRGDSFRQGSFDSLMDEGYDSLLTQNEDNNNDPKPAHRRSLKHKEPMEPIASMEDRDLSASYSGNLRDHSGEQELDLSASFPGTHRRRSSKKANIIKPSPTIFEGDDENRRQSAKYGRRQNKKEDTFEKITKAKNSYTPSFENPKRSASVRSRRSVGSFNNSDASSLRSLKTPEDVSEFEDGQGAMMGPDSALSGSVYSGSDPDNPSTYRRTVKIPRKRNLGESSSDTSLARTMFPDYIVENDEGESEQELFRRSLPPSTFSPTPRQWKNTQIVRSHSMSPPHQQKNVQFQEGQKGDRRGHAVPNNATTTNRTHSPELDYTYDPDGEIIPTRKLKTIPQYEKQNYNQDSRYMDWHRDKESRIKNKHVGDNSSITDDAKIARSASDRSRLNRQIIHDSKLNHYNISNAVDSVRNSNLELLDKDVRLTLGNNTYDDIDSGIGGDSRLGGYRRQPRNHMMERKSVFTIAYDDVKTQHIRVDSSDDPP